MRQPASTISRTRTVAELSEALRCAFEEGVVDDAFADDVLLDGHPPFWRFQLQGRDALAAWLAQYTRHHPRVAVVRTIPTASGFVTEQVAEETTERGLVTSRKVLLCETRDGRIVELTVYCSGDWDADLRRRHAAEAPMVRPS